MNHFSQPAPPADDAAPPFAYVAEQHPWHEPLQLLRAAIAAAPTALAPVPTGSATRQSVHAEIKGVPQGDGRWLLDRAYWSRQQQHPALRWGMHAHTLSSDRSARTQWLTLPQDPYLSSTADWLAHDPRARAVQILRYVPLRRLTLRCRSADGQTPLIGKFKRRSRYAQAYGLIGQVADAVTEAERCGAGPGFRVARPAGLEPARALYFQEMLPGQDVSLGIAPRRGWATLAQIGRLHRRLHGLAIEGLPASTPLQQRDQALSDLGWIAWLQPQLAAQLGPLRERVMRVPPWCDDTLTFCHGDLVCSQFLADGEHWAITDFDLCHRGDPCRDVAILLASLTYDVPALEAAEQADGPGADLDLLCDAYLEGYAVEAARQGRDQGLPSDRLAWQRLCAEIYYLGLMLKKDRCHPMAFARRLRRAEALAGSREWT